MKLSEKVIRTIFVVISLIFIVVMMINVFYPLLLEYLEDYSSLEYTNWLLLIWFIFSLLYCSYCTIMFCIASWRTKMKEES